MSLGQRSEPLAGKRAAIIETIRQAPGINFLNIVEAHQLAYGEAMWHLRRLEVARLVFSARVGRFRRYWATTNGCGPSFAGRIVADPLRAPVLERIRSRPGIRMAELAAAFPDRSRQATAYHARSLEAAGLVRVAVEHRWRRLYAAPAPAEVMA